VTRRSLRKQGITDEHELRDRATDDAFLEVVETNRQRRREILTARRTGPVPMDVEQRDQYQRELIDRICQYITDVWLGHFSIEGEGDVDQLYQIIAVVLGESVERISSAVDIAVDAKVLQRHTAANCVELLIVA